MDFRCKAGIEHHQIVRNQRNSYSFEFSFRFFLDQYER